MPLALLFNTHILFLDINRTIDDLCISESDSLFHAHLPNHNLS